MGFWAFLLICNLLISCTMIGFGKRFFHSPPNKINTLFGYRTAMSMKNEDTWNFAHRYCGKLWQFFGWILLAITVGGMLLIVGKSKDLIGAMGGILCGAQLVFLVGSIVPTEAALKKTFDKNGSRQS